MTAEQKLTGAGEPARGEASPGERPRQGRDLHSRCRGPGVGMDSASVGDRRKASVEVTESGGRSWVQSRIG